MSRKALFGTLTPKSPEPDLAMEDVPAALPQSRVRARPILGSPNLIPDAEARPVGAIGASLGEFNERAKRADEIEKKLTEGQVIVELDTELIDPSFVSDRMPVSEDALSSLTEMIRDHGQLNPILVRPHPDAEGRYQVAFGHRRLRAVKAIGRPVRAVVRRLTDEQLVIAQGQENHEREDLSFIEKALFAHRLEKRGFTRSTIMSAMSVYKSDLSNMLGVVAKIPEPIVMAIGPAPSIGRRGWIELANSAQNHKSAIENAIKAGDFAGLGSDSRFKAVVGATKPQAAKAKAEAWASSKGQPLAKVTHDEGRVMLAIDRRKSPEFAEFVLTRLRDLFEEFEAPS